MASPSLGRFPRRHRQLCSRFYLGQVRRPQLRRIPFRQDRTRVWRRHRHPAIRRIPEKWRHLRIRKNIRHWQQQCQSEDPLEGAGLEVARAAMEKLAVSNDHLIVAQQVSRELSDHGLLVPMVERVQRECGEQPERVSADSGFFSLHNLEERGIDGYVPDSNTAGVLHRGAILKTTYASCSPSWHAQQTHPVLNRYLNLASRSHFEN